MLTDGRVIPSVLLSALGAMAHSIGGPSEFRQADAAIVPGGGVEDADVVQLVDLQACHDLGPQVNSLRIALNRLRRVPEPSQGVLAADQESFAIRANGHGIDISSLARGAQCAEGSSRVSKPLLFALVKNGEQCCGGREKQDAQMHTVNELHDGEF
jgi:hypothetical protein